MEVFDASSRAWVKPACPECASLPPFKKGQKIELQDSPIPFTVVNDTPLLTLEGHAGIQHTTSGLVGLRACSLKSTK